MKRILFLLPTFALLGGCEAVAPFVSLATGPIGQAVFRFAETAVQAIECNVASSAVAGTFKYASSNAVCVSLGGAPVRTVTVPAGTPIAVPAQ